MTARTAGAGKLGGNGSQAEHAILELAGRGLSSRAISKALKDTGVADVSHVAVARVLDRVRSERAVSVKATVRSKLAESATTDIEILERRRCQLGDVIEAGFAAVGADGQPSAFLTKSTIDAIALERKIIETKLRFSGADTPDAPEHDTGAAARIVAKVNRLIEALRPPEPPPEPVQH